ncbi:MAG: FecR domain-containing protein [Cyclobacteriaceae bacterium]
MSNDQKNNLLTQWLNKELSDEELAKVEGKDGLLKYQQILAEIDQWTPTNEEVAFEIPPKEKETKVIQMSKRMAISIAATVSLVAFLSIWMIKWSDQVSYMANAGETKEVMLPDGLSKVILSANAKVFWNKSSWQSDSREILLKGKAYFDIEPGTPFSVNSRNGQIEVLGTTFDVNSFEESLLVVCYSGKVRAIASDESSEIVVGGESIRFHNGAWEGKEMVSDSIPAWISNEIKFTNAPLSEVLTILEDQFDVEFNTSNIKMDRRFSGSVPKDNVQSALRIVFTPLGIKFDQNEQQIILKE